MSALVVIPKGFSPEESASEKERARLDFDVGVSVWLVHRKDSRDGDDTNFAGPDGGT